MNQRLAFPPKVARIMPMMASPVDGEALSACRAVGRVLAQGGLTYRDLAQAIPTTQAAPANGDRRVQTTPAYRPSRRKTFTFTPAQTATHRRMALYCRNADRGRLSRRERDFIADIVAWRRELTIPQADWLTDITDRLEKEDRPAWA